MPIQLSLKQLAFIGEAASRLPDDEIKSVSLDQTPNALTMRVFTLDGRGTLLHLLEIEERKSSLEQVRGLAMERAAKV